MGVIKLDPKKLEDIRKKIENLNINLDSFPARGNKGKNYLSDAIFQESSGKSVESFSLLLQEIEKTAINMSEVVMKTERYLGEIIDGFTKEDKNIANTIKKASSGN